MYLYIYIYICCISVYISAAMSKQGVFSLFLPEAEAYFCKNYYN